MGPVIKVRIDKEGNTHFEVDGVEGTSCEKLTEALIRSVGDEIETEYKEEYIQELPDYIENLEG
jgi:hypothetical protein